MDEGKVLAREKKGLAYRPIPDLSEKELARFHRSYTVEPNSGCWLWTGFARTYGSFHAAKRNWAAHRVSYVLAKGQVPSTLHLDHLCRVPLCVNPDHLEPVTPRENTLRGNAGKIAYELSLQRTHCSLGHEFTPENLAPYVPGKGRICLACRKIRSAKGRERNKVARRVLKDAIRLADEAQAFKEAADYQSACVGFVQRVQQLVGGLQ